MDAVVDHLFRHESGRILAALVRVLGLHNLELAEDIVQDTLVRALETWRFGHQPDNPGAWLMRTARNRALDVVRRDRSFRRFAPDLSYQLDSEWTVVSTLDSAFLDSEVQDDQLRMMFSCCHPRLAPEIQISLMLKVLCGFGTGEIARAFLTNEALVEKRISRGKEALRETSTLYELSSDGAIQQRLDAVLGALYLLFSEGYHGTGAALPIREELCQEAMRLASLLLAHRAAAQPKALALLALMSFHAARLHTRLDDDGCLVLLAAQDRQQWDRRLIATGVELLERAATGDELSEYHLEAGIAAEHCLASSFEETDWRAILELYEVLLRIKPTPVVALNHAIVLGQVKGADEGLAALAAIPEASRPAAYPFYAAARGDMYRRAGRTSEAAASFRSALSNARTEAEAAVFRSYLSECEQATSEPTGSH